MKNTRFGVKSIALIIAALAISCVAIYGTFAWLITVTDPVYNPNLPTRL